MDVQQLENIVAASRGDIDFLYHVVALFNQYLPNAAAIDSANGPDGLPSSGSDAAAGAAGAGAGAGPSTDSLDPASGLPSRRSASAVRDAVSGSLDALTVRALHACLPQLGVRLFGNGGPAAGPHAAAAAAPSSLSGAAAGVGMAATASAATAGLVMRAASLSPMDRSQLWALLDPAKPARLIAALLRLQSDPQDMLLLYDISMERLPYRTVRALRRAAAMGTLRGSPAPAAGAHGTPGGSAHATSGSPGGGGAARGAADYFDRPAYLVSRFQAGPSWSRPASSYEAPSGSFRVSGGGEMGFEYGGGPSAAERPAEPALAAQPRVVFTMMEYLIFALLYAARTPDTATTVALNAYPYGGTPPSTAPSPAMASSSSAFAQVRRGASITQLASGIASGLGHAATGATSHLLHPLAMRSRSHAPPPPPSPAHAVSPHATSMYLAMVHAYLNFFVPLRPHESDGGNGTRGEASPPAPTILTSPQMRSRPQAMRLAVFTLSLAIDLWLTLPPAVAADDSGMAMAPSEPLRADLTRPSAAAAAWGFQPMLPPFAASLTQIQAVQLLVEHVLAMDVRPVWGDLRLGAVGAAASPAARGFYAHSLASSPGSAYGGRGGYASSVNSPYASQKTAAPGAIDAQSARQWLAGIRPQAYLSLAKPLYLFLRHGLGSVSIDTTTAATTAPMAAGSAYGAPGYAATGYGAAGPAPSTGLGTATFQRLVALWLTWLAPWRVLDTGATSPAVSTAAYSATWYMYLLDNLPAYTQLPRLVLQQYAQLDYYKLVRAYQQLAQTKPARYAPPSAAAASRPAAHVGLFGLSTDIYRQPPPPPPAYRAAAPLPAVSATDTMGTLRSLVDALEQALTVLSDASLSRAVAQLERLLLQSALQDGHHPAHAHAAAAAGTGAGSSLGLTATQLQSAHAMLPALHAQFEQLEEEFEWRGFPTLYAEKHAAAEKLADALAMTLSGLQTLHKQNAANAAVGMGRSRSTSASNVVSPLSAGLRRRATTSMQTAAAATAATSPAAAGASVAAAPAFSPLPPPPRGVLGRMMAFAASAVLSVLQPEGSRPYPASTVFAAPDPALDDEDDDDDAAAIDGRGRHGESDDDDDDRDHDPAVLLRAGLHADCDARISASFYAGATADPQGNLAAQSNLLAPAAAAAAAAAQSTRFGGHATGASAIGMRPDALFPSRRVLPPSARGPGAGIGAAPGTRVASSRSRGAGVLSPAATAQLEQDMGRLSRCLAKLTQLFPTLRPAADVDADADTEDPSDLGLTMVARRGDAAAPPSGYPAGTSLMTRFAQSASEVDSETPTPVLPTAAAAGGSSRLPSMASEFPLPRSSRRSVAPSAALSAQAPLPVAAAERPDAPALAYRAGNVFPVRPDRHARDMIMTFESPMLVHGIAHLAGGLTQVTNQVWHVLPGFVVWLVPRPSWLWLRFFAAWPNLISTGVLLAAVWGLCKAYHWMALLMTA